MLDACRYKRNKKIKHNFLSLDNVVYVKALSIFHRGLINSTHVAKQRRLVYEKGTNNKK